MFDSFDLNKSGTIDKSELRQALRDLGIFCTDEELHEMFSVIDSSGDGDLDYGEVRTLLPKLRDALLKLRAGVCAATRASGCAGLTRRAGAAVCDDGALQSLDGHDRARQA